MKQAELEVRDLDPWTMPEGYALSRERRARQSTNQATNQAACYMQLKRLRDPDEHRIPPPQPKKPPSATTVVRWGGLRAHPDLLLQCIRNWEMYSGIPF